MTQIRLDSGLATKLHDLTHVVELCDPSGRILGRFVPILDLSGWEPISPEISEDELDRRYHPGRKRLHDGRGPCLPGTSWMFDVECDQATLDELTTLWVDAEPGDRDDLSSASHAIDQRLKNGPLSEGESREGDRRVTFVAPLLVVFKVDTSRRIAIVLHVRMFRRCTL